MIEIINWKRFQHYAQRDPPWIKLHTGVQDKPEFRNMSAQARALLMDLWLLAAKEKGGQIAKDVQTIAWELREIEVETCLSLREISEVKDSDGNPQWVEWTPTGLDGVLLAQCDSSASTLQAPYTQPASEIDSEPIRIQLREDVKDKTKLETLNTLPHPQKEPASKTLAEQSGEEPEEVAESDEPRPMPEANITDKSFEPEAKTESWLAPYARPYEKRMGAGSFPYSRAAKPMKKLQILHGKPKVQLFWAYACETEKAEYLNPQTFEQKFNMYDPDNDPISELTPELEAG